MTPERVREHVDMLSRSLGQRPYSFSVIEEAFRELIREVQEDDAKLCETLETPQDNWGARRKAIAAAIRSQEVK